MKQDAISLGSHVEPLLDKTLIDSMPNLEFKLHDPVKREIVFEFDQPWETRAPGYSIFLRDENNRIRMYYRACAAGGDLSDQQTSGVAFSDDGINFERPVLGLIEDEGSKDNNLIWRGVEGHNMAVFLDENPDCDPESRYKATGGPMWKQFGLCSPDGIHWRRIQEEPLEYEGVFDTLNIAFWDSNMGCYRSFSRYFDGGWPKGIRAIQSAVSDDFIHWSKPVPNAYASDIPLEHFYTNATIRYPGHPNLLLSFPKRFVYPRKITEVSEIKGVSDSVFMSSRDGVHWDRIVPEAWVRPGRDLLNWTDRSNMIAHGMLELSPDEWSLYVEEHNRCKDKRVRRLTVRKHGFISVHAGYRVGEFTTHPLVFEGSRLKLNFSTAAPGGIQVEILEADGKPIPGFTLEDMEVIYGDFLDREVAWKNGGDLSALKGRPVRFRFVMSEADLFAVQIE